MASSPPAYINGQETPIIRPAARRTPSFSSSSRSHSWDSSSSSLSFNEELFPTYTPSQHLKFNGIPFSWEKIPGIPKQQSLEKKDTSAAHLLPLPPAGNSNSAAKKLQKQEEISPKKYKRDPFFAALVECSKDDDHDIGPNFGNILKGSLKITRSLSDRFGFINMYTSCKRTCAVSESLVYVPRGSPHYLLHRRSS